MSDRPQETPFIELLRGVETDAVGSYEMRDGGFHHVPFGRYCHQAADRIADLEARLAAAEADAERYRHLKASGAFRAFSLDMSGKHTWIGVGRPIGEGSTIDEAIDAARGGE